VRRAWILLATVAAAVIGLAGPALAHVEVQPAEAAAGQPASFAFRVPNEQSNANTVSLVVRFPADHPVPGVVPTAPDGWTVETTNRTLATPLTVAGTAVTEVVDTITWRGSMAPGRAEYFPVTTGPLPSDTGELVFDTTQSYDNGVTSYWNKVEVAGQPDSDYPAPVLLITGGSVPVASTGADHEHTATTASSGGGMSGGAVFAVVAAAAVAIAAVTVVLYRRVGRSPARSKDRR
jgi:uncharacterized protein YcnI